MLPVALLCILTVLLSAANVLPLYTETVLTPQKDFLQKIVKEVEDEQNDELGAQRNEKTIYPYLLYQESNRDDWPKGAKDTFQQDRMNNMVDVLKTMVLKLAASDTLRSQGYFRSEQNLPKPNKRACFWKYCVTN